MRKEKETDLRAPAYKITESARGYALADSALRAMGDESGPAAKKLIEKRKKFNNYNTKFSMGRPMSEDAKLREIRAWNKGATPAYAQASLTQTNASDRFGAARKSAIAKKVK